MNYTDPTEEQKPSCEVTGKSAASSHGDMDTIEQAESQEPYADPRTEKDGTRVSLELKRTASRTSNALERVFTTRSIVDPGPPPDGGWKAWSQVCCGWMVLFCTWGWINSYGAFQAYYTIHLDESPSNIAFIGGVQNFLTFFIGAFSGRLLDAGFFVPTLLVGAIFQLLGMFLMSVSKTFWQLMLTQGVLTGLGGGIFFTPSMGLMATYFSSKRAFAIGLATSGNAVGGMIYPIVVRELLPKVGFSWTCRVLGFLNLSLLSVVLAFMRPRLPPRKSGPIIDWSAWTERPYALFVAGLFFAIWTTYYTLYYVGSFGVERLGMNYASATSLVIIVNAVGVPARTIPPFFADKIGQLNIFCPALALLTVLTFSWLAVQSIAGLYAWVILYGLASGSFQCLVPSTIAALTPELNMVGTRLGMAFSTVSFAALTGPPIGGALQTAMGGRYTGATIWAAIATLLGFAFVTGSRMSRVGFALRKKC